VSVSVTPQRESGRGGVDDLKLVFAGASSDFGHVIFEANDALTPATPVAPPAVDGEPVANNLYEWLNGELRLVNVLPGNVTIHPGAVFGSGSTFSTAAGDPDFTHAISTDGSRIFWTNEENHRLYVRENGDETAKIQDTGGFFTASADGSKVLLSDGHLYDLETEESVDLTGKQGGFAGILGTSEDLSTVYFVDTAKLTSEENGEHDVAQAGQYNLYYWNSGVSVFVATLNPKDSFNGGALGLVDGNTSDWAASPSDRTARVSNDGRYVTFMSFAEITPYNNNVPSGECIKGVGAACAEVFEYDAASHRLACASCNPTGERPRGSSVLGLIAPGSGFLPQPSNLSQNGQVFFNSLDVLSPQDKNPGVENVYEFEPGGVGTCKREGGCIYLISSGTGETDSGFVNATPSGSDVFFTTRSQLLPEDQDDLVDLYDARENGGFLPINQPPECTTSETCQGASSSSPPVETPLSTRLSGTGNLTPAVTSPPPPPVPPSPLTRAQRLAKALAACHKQKGGKKQRAACETRARKLYETKKTKRAGKAAKGKPSEANGIAKAGGSR
jgi:hypothetical protein